MRHVDTGLDELEPSHSLLHRTHVLIQSSLDVDNIEEASMIVMEQTLLSILERPDTHMDVSRRSAPVTFVLRLNRESGRNGNAFLEAATAYGGIVARELEDLKQTQDDPRSLGSHSSPVVQMTKTPPFSLALLATTWRSAVRYSWQRACSTTAVRSASS